MVTSSLSVSRETSGLCVLGIAIFLFLIFVPIRFTIGPLQMTGLRLYFLLLAIPLLVTWLATPQLRKDPVPWLLMLFVGWGAVAISQTSLSHLIENTGVLWLEVVCPYLLARICLRQARDLQTMILIAATGLLAITPLAILEARTGEPLIIRAVHSLTAITSVDVVTIAPRLGLERVQAVFAHPIHFGLFACALITLVGLGLKDRITAPARTLLITTALICTVLSLSSGPLLALVVQVALLAWALVFGAKLRSWLWLLGLLAAAYIAVDLMSNRTPIRVFMSYATFSPHNAFWRGLIFEWGIWNVWNHPIFGLGFNSWERPPFMISGSIDNFWLATAIKYGIPGFVLTATATGLAVWRGLPRGESAASPLHLAMSLTLVALVFALCTVHIWTALHAFFFFLLGAGQFKASVAQTTKNDEPISQELTYWRSDLARPYAREGLSL